MRIHLYLAKSAQEFIEWANSAFARLPSTPASHATFTDAAVASHEPKAEAAVLSCIDYRFFAKYAEKLCSLGYHGLYDHIIFPGAELGALMCEQLKNEKGGPKPPPNTQKAFGDNWNGVFDEQLGVALALHKKINTLIVFSHRECGAYGPKGFQLLCEGASEDEEKAVHDIYLNKFDKYIKSKPEFNMITNVYLLLLPVPKHCTSMFWFLPLLR